MADQKKWFKVWGSILVDPDHSNLSLEDVGRWTRLGAYMVTCGERGKMTIIPPAKTFLLAMSTNTIEEAVNAIKRLPNVQIRPMLRRGVDDNGSFIVIIKNWFKYQVDSTAYDRVKRSRYKKRGEEKRREETSSFSEKETPEWM